MMAIETLLISHSSQHVRTALLTYKATFTMAEVWNYIVVIIRCHLMAGHVLSWRHIWRSMSPHGRVYHLMVGHIISGQRIIHLSRSQKVAARV